MVRCAGQAGKGVVEIATNKSLRSCRSGAIDARIRQAPEHNIRSAGARAVRTGAGSTNDDVGQAVAVQISGPSHRMAAIIVRRLAVNLKAIGSIQTRQTESGTEPASFPENHV